MIDLKNHKHIHCIGIGGIGLSAIAELFLARGYIVSGSDLKSTEVTQRLEKDGALIFTDHAAENILGADLVIYSAAVSADNPEILEAILQNIQIATRAEVLGWLMKEYNSSIAISGTHGKTTTTSMVSLILRDNLLDPTILVGGNLSEIGGNVKIGKSDYFVTEACEYMDSFLSLHPKIEIILNIDSDHLDYFKDIDHIASSFQEFAGLVPKDGYVIAYSSNPFVSSLLADLSCNVVTFGFEDTCDYLASSISFDTAGMPSFDIYHHGKKLCDLHLSIPGEHNIANALAAFACCHTLGLNADCITPTLSAFSGTQRRFDIIGITSGSVKVVDDYAHHPTEIKATLKAAKNIPHRKLWCIFQPHTYTRTLALFDDFATSFKHADTIILAEIYAAREKNIYKISSEKLAEAVRENYPGKEVLFLDDFDVIADYLLENTNKGDLVITMGAGDIYKVAELILEKDAHLV
jgi:UDP-N-acetylmuramate--alanine ligase